MTRVTVLVGIAAVLVWPVRSLLLGARWTERVPRSAIVIWQAIGCALAIALLGGVVELFSLPSSGGGPRRSVTDLTTNLLSSRPTQATTPGELFALTAGLIVGTLVLGGLAARTVGHARRRARQRLLIDLVGTRRPGVPEALVLSHPQATAFSVPGLRPRVVVSTGAIEMLAEDELAAVLAHEWAHVRARHDLVLLPFRALAGVLPRSRALALVRQQVAALVEMAADDRVLRDCEPGALARALCRLALAEVSPPIPAGAAGPMGRRVERALGGRPHARLLVCSSALSAAAVLALPLVALLAPLGGR